MEAIILNRKFLGPFNSIEKIKNRAGVYLIICEAFGMTPIRILDSGDVENVKETLRKENKQKFFEDNKEVQVKFLIHYEDDNNLRSKLKRDIKKVLYT